jgi:hypothetical protein
VTIPAIDPAVIMLVPGGWCHTASRLSLFLLFVRQTISH